MKIDSMFWVSCDMIAIKADGLIGGYTAISRKQYYLYKFVVDESGNAGEVSGLDREDLLYRTRIDTSVEWPETSPEKTKAIRYHILLTGGTLLTPLFDRYCDRCRQEARRKCSRCLKAYYCTPECQRAAWKEHKSFCVDEA